MQRRLNHFGFLLFVPGLHQKATSLPPQRASCSHMSRLWRVAEFPSGRISEKMQFKDADGKEVPRSPGGHESSSVASTS